MLLVTKNFEYIYIFTDFQNETRKIWNAVNQLKNNYSKTYLLYISVRNKILRYPSEISDPFNKYYANIAVNFENNIPPPTTDTDTFLQGDNLIYMSAFPSTPKDVTYVTKSWKTKKKKNKCN